MVAYSFQQRFVPLILAGAKRQTIRSDRKRHAHPGETLQLYTAMRTRSCALIGVAMCERVVGIRVAVDRGWVEISNHARLTGPDLERFAQADGFADWEDMRAFWQQQHPEAPLFTGHLIVWNSLVPAPGLEAQAAPTPLDPVHVQIAPQDRDAVSTGLRERASTLRWLGKDRERRGEKKVAASHLAQAGRLDTLADEVDPAAPYSVLTQPAAAPGNAGEDGLKDNELVIEEGSRVRLVPELLPKARGQRDG